MEDHVAKKVMSNTTRFSNKTNPPKSQNVKKAGYDKKDEQGKQSPTAKPGAFYSKKGVKALSKEVSSGLKKARGGY